MKQLCSEFDPLSSMDSGFIKYINYLFIYRLIAVRTKRSV